METFREERRKQNSGVRLLEFETHLLIISPWISYLTNPPLLLHLNKKKKGGGMGGISTVSIIGFYWAYTSLYVKITLSSSWHRLYCIKFAKQTLASLTQWT